jgi:FMN-dependent NADH-azoreductase
MMRLLIDAPVSAFSSPAEIRAWLDRLQVMRRSHAGDEQALRDIERAETEARTYLELAERSSRSI